MEKKDYYKTKELIISLTGENSHKIILESGVGSISIGTKGKSNGKFDILFEENKIINWNAFNDCVKSFYPWPRFFYYSGNDIGFIEWSKTRRIEEFAWHPLKEIKVDFTDANISRLELHAENKIELSIGNNINYLDLYGTISNYYINRCDSVPALEFWFKQEKDIKTYKLPNYDSLKLAKVVQITIDPMGVPFDCKTLLQFKDLEEVNLNGNMINLEILKEFKKLKKIGLWNIKNLSDFPELSTWNELSSFIAVNIDETVGKRIREELKPLIKSEKLEDYSNVSNLRNMEWFEKNCGIPFTYWDRNEKKAMRIYNSCLKKVSNSKTEDEIKEAVIEYTNSFNSLKDIESIEQDDIYSSLCIIMKYSPITIEEEKWLDWFEQTREF